MNISSIVLKGNDKGIRLIIAKDATINNILNELDNMLSKQSYNNQTNNEIKLTFEGKILTMDERKLILKVLSSYGIKIQADKENSTHKCELSDKHNNDGLFYVGNLKNGQVLEAKDSIIIVGNIEQGAAVYSDGNILITGYLYGYAKAKFVYSYMSGRNIE